MRRIDETPKRHILDRNRVDWCVTCGARAFGVGCAFAQQLKSPEKKETPRTVYFTYIIGKKFLSLKPVVRTRRSYKRAGLIKRQKSFQGIAMYGHEVLMSLQKRAKLFATHF
jgi:hypothetical protein